MLLSFSASLTLILILNPVLACNVGRNNLTLLTRTSCVCPGHQLLYGCKIAGSAIQYTVWKGSALSCNGEASLRHGQFITSGYANATCNSGEVFARIVNITDNCYISQLIVNTSLSLNGRSIECAFDNGATEETVDSAVIRITTASFPPPNDVRLVDMQPEQLIFSWTSVDAQCDSVSYNIFSSNCGRCLTATTNTTVTCTGIVVDASAQMCTFVVQTVVCGNLTGNRSHPVNVILKAPKVQDVHAVPMYDYVTGDLISISLSFQALDSFMISDGFENHITTYTITYSDSATGNICSKNSVTPALSCQDGICIHTFKVSSSYCNLSANITATVVTTTALGSTAASDPLMIGSSNQFLDVDLSFDVTRLRVNCMFLNTVQMSYERSCAVEFGFGKEGRCAYGDLSYTLSSENSNTNDSHMISIEVPILLMKNDVLCFVVTAHDNRDSAKVEIVLTISSGCDVNQLAEGDIIKPPGDIHCGSPLLTAGIKDGLVCYTGTHVGAVATYQCFDCGFNQASSRVRTCMQDGTWNGTVLHCDCIDKNVNSTLYTAISMGVIIVILIILLIIVIVLLITLVIRSKSRMNKMMAESRVYEEIVNFDDTKNVAYMKHHMHHRE